MPRHENTPFAGPPVGLEEMLAARDRRVARRQSVRDRLGLPTVTLTVVMPGPVKDNRMSRLLAAEGCRAVGAEFRRLGWPIDEELPKTRPAGPEALFAVDADPQDIKRAMVALEESHPLGRLWDLDVHSATGEAVSRGTLGIGPRRCLVCGEAAHACARSRAHSLEDLLQAIERTVGRWRAAAIDVRKGEE